MTMREAIDALNRETEAIIASYDATFEDERVIRRTHNDRRRAALESLIGTRVDGAYVGAAFARGASRLDIERLYARSMSGQEIKRARRDIAAADSVATQETNDALREVAALRDALADEIRGAIRRLIGAFRRD